MQLTCEKVQMANVNASESLSCWRNTVISATRVTPNTPKFEQLLEMRQYSPSHVSYRKQFMFGHSESECNRGSVLLGSTRTERLCDKDQVVSRFEI